MPNHAKSDQPIAIFAFRHSKLIEAQRHIADMPFGYIVNLRTCRVLQYESGLEKTASAMTVS